MLRPANSVFLQMMMMMMMMMPISMIIYVDVVDLFTA
jgi:hypothetical protein